ncbi:MAG: hypothetical protein OXC69_07860, partial [Candidatus Tectomicrobia bacterium]|nr:hypothetical protein [Candidatus Tectomicrobia bacterium]
MGTGTYDRARGAGRRTALRHERPARVAPGGLLGEGGSVYVVTGVHWERISMRRGSDIGGESIWIVVVRTLRPWGAGVGVERISASASFTAGASG